jgi:hypothetical protein
MSVFGKQIALLVNRCAASEVSIFAGLKKFFHVKTGFYCRDWSWTGQGEDTGRSIGKIRANTAKSGIDRRDVNA